MNTKLAILRLFLSIICVLHRPGIDAAYVHQPIHEAHHLLDEQHFSERSEETPSNLEDNDETEYTVDSTVFDEETPIHLDLTDEALGKQLNLNDKDGPVAASKRGWWGSSRSRSSSRGSRRSTSRSRRWWGRSRARAAASRAAAAAKGAIRRAAAAARRAARRVAAAARRATAAARAAARRAAAAARRAASRAAAALRKAKKRLANAWKLKSSSSSGGNKPFGGYRAGGRNTDLSPSGLRRLYNSRIVGSITRVERPLDGLKGSLGPVSHTGVVVKTKDGKSWLIQKGGNFGGRGGQTVVTDASHMSKKWIEIGTHAGNNRKIAEFVKAGGTGYSWIFNNCHHGSSRMCKLGK